MIFKLLLGAILFISCLNAHEETPAVLSIQSNTADYNGNTIVLKGNVLVEHALGTLTADQIELQSEMVDGKAHWHHILLQGNVDIAFKAGGHLSCGSAKIDYGKRQGSFFGNADRQAVYTESPAGKTVSLKADELNIRLAKMEDQTAPSHNAIEHVNAQGNVSIRFDTLFVATGDHAVYDCTPPKNPATGLITLYRDKPESMCQIANNNGDMVSAKEIDIDLSKQHFSFTSPQGALTISNQTERPEQVEFSGDYLFWDEAKSLLTLSGNVEISQEGFGHLSTDKEVKMAQHLVEGKKRVQSIETSGATTLTFNDDASGLLHTLNCYGKVFVDHALLKTLMESPRDAQGNVVEGKQISFQDIMGNIYADKLTMHYKAVDHKLIPTKLRLEGHVRILNRFVKDPNKKDQFLQYALAEIVEYAPDAKEIILSTTKKERVLFFDKLNNLQVSAPALTIRRDKATQKEMVQGRGDVRFSFVKRELEEIYKHLNIDLRTLR